jgi:hypothetical protein
MAILNVIALAWLPGALIFRLPIERDARAALPAEERLFWAVAISVTWSIALVMALAAFGAYTLERVVWINAGIAGLVVVITRGRLRYGAAAPRPSWTLLLPIALAALGASLYFPTAEYVMGGKDPGVYINEGVQISKQHSLVIQDETIGAVPYAVRGLFVRPPSDQGPYPPRFMGFFLTDPDGSRVLAQFPAWYSASVALGYDVAGVTGALSLVGIWSVLGLVAVYLVGARLFDPITSALATLLLAINVLEVWFGRYPNSEMASQAMLFAAFLAFRRAIDGSRVFFGSLAGLLVGLQLFLRYDALLAAGAFLVAATLASAVRERAGWPFLIALALSSALGYYYLAVPMLPYSLNYQGTTRDMGGWWAVGGLLVAAVAFMRLMRVERLRWLVVRWLPRGLAAVLAVLAIYALFFREPTDMSAPGALRNFGWYITTAGVLLALAGFIVAAEQRFWRDPAFFITFAIYALFIFYKPRIVPEHFWVGRRFVTIILPAAMLLIAGLATWILSLDRLARWRGRTPARGLRVASAVLSVAVLTPLGVWLWQRAEPVRAHVEYAGLEKELGQILASFGPDDLLLVESRETGSDLHVLATPLAYLYDRHVLVLWSRTPHKRGLEQFIAWAATKYPHVYFLGGGGTDLLSRNLDAEPVATRAFRVPEYDAPINAYPAGPRQKDFAYGLYRLTTASRPPGPIDLRIGELDDLSIIRFHARERRSDGTAFRWTRDASYVMLVGMGANARELTVWLSSGGRPAKAPPPVVEVWIGNHPLGTATPDDSFKPYRFAIPQAIAQDASETPDPVRLMIRVVPWVPRDLLGGTDTRDLGVMVSRIQVQ